jgi:copper chaperone CopZ
VPHDVVVLLVEGLDHVASPVALEAALVRTAGVGSVSMNVAAGRVRIAFDPDRLGLRDLVAIVCAAGCGLYVSETVVRVRSLDYPWRSAAVTELLRDLPGVVDAGWDRETEFVVVSYLPSRIRSGELLDAIVKAGYRLSRDAVMVSEVPAVYAAAAAHRTSRRRVLSAR